MKKTERFRFIVMLIVLASLTVVCANLDSGGQEAVQVTAAIKEFSGRVQVLKASEGEFRAATVDTMLETNDQVLTGEDGRARIDLSDGTIIRLSPLSNFVLTAVETTDAGTLTRLQLNIGRLWIILKGGVVEVDTPSGLASVRGSYLHVWVDPLAEETNVTCLEGECALGNDLGAVSLVAGQTAKISGSGDAPEAGKMTHEDVEEWLDSNPEATLVVVPLTATVAAGEGEPLPQLETNTPTPTKTVGPTPTLGPSSTPTKTLFAANCGPFEGWVLHTVREGETLKTLSLLYRVTEAELRQANCRGEMGFVVAGEKLYVPNVSTSTPTSTPTLTPKATATPKGTLGGGGGTGPTATNSPTTLLSALVGPDNATVSDLLSCYYSYGIYVKDPDGITEVKLIYSFDGSLPDYDTAVSAGKYKVLSKLGTDHYGVNKYMIDTTSQTPPVNVRYRFTVKDSLGNITHFPAGDAYEFIDPVGCGTNATPTSNILTSPNGALIQSSVDCPKDFIIDVSDDNGIKEVKMFYTITAGDGVTTSSSVYKLMTLTTPNGLGTGGEYSLLGFTIDTTGFGPDPGPPIVPSAIDFDFVVYDGLGTQSTVFSGTFDDEFGCP